MEVSKFSNWLQAAGAIGVIASLVLVAVQLRDSNRIASGQMFSESVDSTITVNVAQLGETPNESMVRVLYKPETATVEDYYVADRIYDVLFRILVRIHVFHDLGLYGTEGVDPRGFISVHYHVFACPYGLAWLDQAKDAFPNNAKGSPIYESLNSLRQLAKTNSADSRMMDRQERAQKIIDELAGTAHP